MNKIFKNFLKDKEFGLLSLFKELVAICVLFPLLYNFCSAEDFIIDNGLELKIQSSNDVTGYNITNTSGNVTCLWLINATYNSNLYWSREYPVNISSNEYDFAHIKNGGAYVGYDTICFTGNKTMYFKRVSSSSTITIHYLNYPLGNNSCPSCPTCPSQYTSLECQTEYNLIPISSVTSAYCETNFNLIDPATCPINEGTGAINWSSLFINNTQYAGNDEIQILFPDYLAWNIVFNTGVTYVEVEGYNADTEYIEDVIAKEKLTPTADDFSFLIENLGAYIPILAVAGLLIRGAWILKKVF